MTRESFSARVSLAFWYAYTLARRRGDHDIEKSSTSSQNQQDIDDYDEVTTSRKIGWHTEFQESYRYLREHGNSAFIFVLELALAALSYLVIKKPGQSPAQQLGAIGFLFFIWAAPSMFVHLLGQHLERRFSRFDQRVAAAQARSPDQADGRVAAP